MGALGWLGDIGQLIMGYMGMQSSQEQWDLINLLDRYAFFRYEGEYYAGESPSQSMIYLRKAKSLKKEIKIRFGHVLKK